MVGRIKTTSRGYLAVSDNYKWIQNDMDLIIRRCFKNTGGVLIELPGIILASFVPILENTQNMQQ
jgi:hypothetical protein